MELDASTLSPILISDIAFTSPDSRVTVSEPLKQDFVDAAAELPVVGEDGALAAAV